MRLRVPAFRSRSADPGPPSPQPGGRCPSPSTDPSPVWSGPLGPRARWLGRPCATGHSQGRVGHSWGLGPGLPSARAKGSQTGLFTLRVPCPCPACLFRVWVQQQRSRKFSSGSGKRCLRQGARHLPLVPGFRGGWDRGARRGHRVPGSPWPPRPQGAHRPTWLLQGGQGCQSWARGPGRVASPACAGTWRLPRPRLQPRLGSPGLLGGQVRLLALRATLRAHSGGVRPPGRRAGAGAGTERPRCPRPSPPASTGLPWLGANTQVPQAALKMIPLGGTVAPEMGPPWRGRPLPPPFVSQKSPSEASGATPASRVGLAPLGCWGSCCVCLWLLVGVRVYLRRTSQALHAPGDPSPRLSGSKSPPSRGTGSLQRLYTCSGIPLGTFRGPSPALPGHRLINIGAGGTWPGDLALLALSSSGHPCLSSLARPPPPLAGRAGPKWD